MYLNVVAFFSLDFVCLKCPCTHRELKVTSSQNPEINSFFPHGERELVLFPQRIILYVSVF